MNTICVTGNDKWNQSLQPNRGAANRILIMHPAHLARSAERIAPWGACNGRQTLRMGYRTPCQWPDSGCRAGVEPRT